MCAFMWLVACVRARSAGLRASAWNSVGAICYAPARQYRKAMEQQRVAYFGKKCGDKVMDGEGDRDKNGQMGGQTGRQKAHSSPLFKGTPFFAVSSLSARSELEASASVRSDRSIPLAVEGELGSSRGLSSTCREGVRRGEGQLQHAC
jgi:hypothetical protein